MGNNRLAKNASILVFLAVVALAPNTASAGDHNYPVISGFDPSPAYSVPMSSAYPLAGFISDPTCPACSYTVPILAVYQCPAALADQPGSQVIYMRTDPAYGLLGGRPYLYHH